MKHVTKMIVGDRVIRIAGNHRPADIRDDLKFLLFEQMKQETTTKRPRPNDERAVYGSLAYNLVNTANQFEF